MLTTLVLIVHLLVCIALILIILLQTGKGADIGAVFGGGSSQTVFGSSGATTFLSKVTIIAAVLFMCTSIVLTYFSDKGVAVTERSVVTESTVPGVPGAADSAGTGMPIGQQSPTTTPTESGADQGGAAK